MRKTRLLWHLYSLQILVLLATLFAVAWFGSNSLRQLYLDQMTNDLKARAELVTRPFTELLFKEKFNDLNKLCLELGPPAQTRITIILPSGKIAGDSDEKPERMENHADRPEIIAALARGIGSSTRFSHTLQENMMYVAIPLHKENTLLGILRTSRPTTFIEQRFHTLDMNLALGAIAVALLGVVATLFVSHQVSRPLEKMKQGADQFALGQLDHKLEVTGSYEIAGLADSLNRMAEQLNDRMNTVIEQHNELETVFSNMIEGVITIDTHNRLLSINNAAADLLEIDGEKSIGMPIAGIITNYGLKRFIRKTLHTEKPVEEEIVFQKNEEDKYFQLHGATLSDAKGRATGALIVINDVTRLLRLENVRREFVANVSHELKTPITSIKGFAEILAEGAMEDNEKRNEFLAIIARQANRLHAIVDDLLSISRIEQEVGKNEVILENAPIKPVLEAVLAACRLKGQEKEISLHLHCTEDLAGDINPPLLEQAVTNLVVNAIKYSNARSSIQIEATVQEEAGGVEIRVIDHGCGIEKQHIPRLFERFYRTDKARSRKLGGTGLGLAIVKHIAQAHHGEVTVDSTPGQGTTFTLLLPASQNKEEHE